MYEDIDTFETILAEHKRQKQEQKREVRDIPTSEHPLVYINDIYSIDNDDSIDIPIDMILKRISDEEESDIYTLEDDTTVQEEGI